MFKKTQCDVKEKSVCLRCNKQIKPGSTGWVLNIGACHCEDPELLKTDNEKKSDSSNVELTADADIPTSIDGKYEVLSMLGKGGMGTVYKVRDSQLDRIFALKILHKDITRDSASLKRFQQEVEAAEKLNHPNLVPVYGHGVTQSEEAYLVMEYVEGETLAQRLERVGTLDEDPAIDILLQICSALSHAHEMKIIHRDIKPANILLSKDEFGEEVVRVVDFGIAKTLPGVDRETRDLTQTGEVFGSPHYMSPEQCLGFMLDQRSDIYSFGCMMYEMLSGKTPFAGNNPIQLLVKHINEAAKPYATTIGKNPKVRGLQLISLKCLQKQQVDRFQDVDEIAESLLSLSEGKKLELLDPRLKLSAITTKIAVLGFIVPIVIVGLVFLSILNRSGIIQENISANFASLFAFIGVSSFAWIYYELGRLCIKIARNRESQKKHWWITLCFFASAVVFGSMAPEALSLALRSDGLIGPGQLPPIFHYYEALTLAGYILTGLSSIFALVCSIGYLLANDKKVKLSAILWRAGLVSTATSLGLYFALPKESAAVLSWMGETLSAYPEELKCGVSAGCADLAFSLDKTNTDTVTECANANYWNHRYRERIENYKTLLALTPESKKHDLSTFHATIGRSYEKLGEYQMGLDELSKSIALDPLSGSALLSRGDVYANMQNYDAAIQDYTNALEFIPDRGRVYYDRANTYLRSAQYDKAIEDYNQIIRVNEKWPTQLVCRAIAYEKKGDLARSAEDMKSALNLDVAQKDQNYAFHIAKGLAHIKLGQPAEAQKEFLQAKRSKYYSIRDLRWQAQFYPEELQKVLKEHFPGLSLDL